MVIYNVIKTINSQKRFIRTKHQEYKTKIFVENDS